MKSIDASLHDSPHLIAGIPEEFGAVGTDRPRPRREPSVCGDATMGMQILPTEVAA